MLSVLPNFGFQKCSMWFKSGGFLGQSSIFTFLPSDVDILFTRWHSASRDSFVKSNKKLDKQSTTVSSSVPELNAIQCGGIEGYSVGRSRQYKNNEKIDTQGKKEKEREYDTHYLQIATGVFFSLR